MHIRLFNPAWESHPVSACSPGASSIIAPTLTEARSTVLASQDFLWDFSQYYLDYNANSDPHFDHKLGSSNEIGTNFDYLKRQIGTYIYGIAEPDLKHGPNTDIGL